MNDLKAKKAEFVSDVTPIIKKYFGDVVPGKCQEILAIEAFGMILRCIYLMMKGWEVKGGIIKTAAPAAFGCYNKDNDKEAVIPIEKLIGATNEH